MEQDSINALTVTYNGLTDCIKSPVLLSNPYDKQSISTQGIWDTGATSSVITKDAAKALGLKISGFKNVRGVHGVKLVPTYMVTITLNNRSIIIKSEVTECDALSDNNDTGLLIGMNIITRGDFIITNAGGKTVMSFRVPSQSKVDFVEDIEERNRIKKIHEIWKKKGIDKCPCRSGKLYKNCHGKK